jgi:flagellar basal body-associated protein FliL
MIKNDPQRMAMRKSARAFVILGIFIIALSIIFFFLPSSGHRFTFPLFYLFFILLFAALFALLSVLFTKADKRRALALQGDQSILAMEQPVSNANALVLPLTIELRPGRTYFPFFVGLVIIGGFIAGFIAYFSSTKNNTGHQASLLVVIIIVAVILAVLILLVALFYFILRRQMRYQVQVDEQGIEVRYNRITTRVNWNEARLFTVNAVKKARRPKTYELASTDTIVRWTWIPGDITPLFMLKPTIPQQDYDRQMQSLLEVVAGRTHLPLYDISQQKAAWYM